MPSVFSIDFFTVLSAATTFTSTLTIILIDGDSEPDDSVETILSTFVFPARLRFFTAFSTITFSKELFSFSESSLQSSKIIVLVTFEEPSFESATRTPFLFIMSFSTVVFAM